MKSSLGGVPGSGAGVRSPSEASMLDGLVRLDRHSHARPQCGSALCVCACPMSTLGSLVGAVGSSAVSGPSALHASETVRQYRTPSRHYKRDSS